MKKENKDLMFWDSKECSIPCQQLLNLTTNLLGFQIPCIVKSPYLLYVRVHIHFARLWKCKQNEKEVMGYCRSKYTDKQNEYRSCSILYDLQTSEQPTVLK